MAHDDDTPKDSHHLNPKKSVQSISDLPTPPYRSSCTPPSASAHSHPSLGDMATPTAFTSLAMTYERETDITNFGDLPTPADRSDSVGSVLGSQGIALDSILGFDSWDLGERYQIERVIGRGSYGEVVQAFDLKYSFHFSLFSSHSFDFRTETYVAIKRIRNIFDSTIDAKRIYREMFILR